MTLNIVISIDLRSNNMVHKFWQLNRKSSEEIRYYCHNQAKPDVAMDLKAIKEEKPQVKRIENKEDYID